LTLVVRRGRLLKPLHEDPRVAYAHALMWGHSLASLAQSAVLQAFRRQGTRTGTIAELQRAAANYRTAADYADRAADELVKLEGEFPFDQTHVAHAPRARGPRRPLLPSAL
jgi:hypothetical protein